MAERKHSRHLTNIPFNYSLKDVVAHKTEYLKNVSVGGLSFRSSVLVKKGSTIKIEIPLLRPVFCVTGTVVWCRKTAAYLYDVGVKFADIKSRLHARMFEQVCFIEQYKQQVLETTGRNLTSEEAAIEWIKKYAQDFDE